MSNAADDHDGGEPDEGAIDGEEDDFEFMPDPRTTKPKQRLTPVMTIYLSTVAIPSLRALYG